jgi:hypothetical protein
MANEGNDWTMALLGRHVVTALVSDWHKIEFRITARHLVGMYKYLHVSRLFRLHVL